MKGKLAELPFYFEKGHSMISFKVGVKTKEDTEWVFNGLRFSTHEAAEEYAKDLFRRWTAVQQYTVVSSEDAPNASFPVPSETYKVDLR
jgi:hypothetical protein